MLLYPFFRLRLQRTMKKKLRESPLDAPLLFNNKTLLEVKDSLPLAVTFDTTLSLAKSVARVYTILKKATNFSLHEPDYQHALLPSNVRF